MGRLLQAILALRRLTFGCLSRRCSLFGGFTVLSTKALSSLLSGIYFEAFALPLTWCLLAVLIATSLCQIKYLNKALQTFESRVGRAASFPLQ